MSRLTGNLQNAPVDTFQNLAAASAGNAQQGGAVLGAMITAGDGREFRWVLAGGVTLAAGKLQQSPAQVTNNQDMAVVQAQAIGDTQVTVTLGGTAVTANQYAGGYLTIEEGTGLGYSYLIASHPAQATTNGNVVITLVDPLVIALDTTSKASLVYNPYNGVIVNPATASGIPVGVAVWALPTATYGWIQTHGTVACLNDSGTAIGLGVTASASVAGAVKTAAATVPQIGSALNVGTDTKYCAIWLTL